MIRSHGRHGAMRSWWRDRRQGAPTRLRQQTMQGIKTSLDIFASNTTFIHGTRHSAAPERCAHHSMPGQGPGPQGLSGPRGGYNLAPSALLSSGQLAASMLPRTASAVDAMAHQMVIKTTIKPHLSNVRLYLTARKCCCLDTGRDFRCMRVRFPPTAPCWPLVVLTRHSASPILPQRQRCTLFSAVSMCEFLFPFLRVLTNNVRCGMWRGRPTGRVVSP